MKTNWHKKPTFSGRYLNFYSHHPYNYKINVVNNLIDRGITLSQKDFHKENIEKIRSILQKNNYPPSIINLCIKKRLNHLYASGMNSQPHHPLYTTLSHTQTTHPNPAGHRTSAITHTSPKYMPLPYVLGLSEKLSLILKSFNIRIASRNVNDLSRFFKSTKDRISKLDTADVIYNIPCSDCTATYIGTTKRPLKTRLHEHKRDVYDPPDKWTVLTKHTWQQDHTFSFDNVQIVDKSVNYKKRMILEMNHIASNPNLINQRSDTENLSVLYHPLLKSKP